jgi:predicted RNA methylase
MDGKTTTNNSVYFQSYDDLEVHRLMLKDASRTDTYRSALMNNADKLKDKIVMDVGAGTGILSLFCKAAGAKKIYAIEASPMAYKLEEIVKLNNAEDVIQVLKATFNEYNLKKYGVSLKGAN